MRIHRSMQFLMVVATLAACTPNGGPRTGVEVSAQWDSGPLDRAYGREHDELAARHAQEISAPRDSESAYDRDHRQAAESKDLEARYSKGKADHSDTMPPK
jgi:hypothetical protein